MTNIKEEFGRKIKELNWLVITLVVVLSYGFLLSNPSIGIDDENFDYYFKYNGIVACGRWGSWLIGKVFNTYSYLPVWRDFIAITLLIIAAIVFVCTFESASGKVLDKTISTITVCLVISYPIISKMFLYIDNSVETSFCILFSILAYRIYCCPASDKYRWIRLAAVIALLIIGCALIENTIIYFCVEVCLFGYVREREENIIQEFLVPVLLCIVAAVITKVIGRLVPLWIGVGYLGDYASQSYFVWDLISSVSEFLEFVYRIRDRFLFFMGEYFSVKLFAGACIFWLLAAVVSFVQKKYKKGIYALGIIVASFAMYILTCNGWLPLRIFTVYFIAVAGAFLLIYDIIFLLKRQKLKNICTFLFVCLAALSIFYATKESNEYYQLDYKRYLRDVDVARNVNYDIGKEVGTMPSLPVVFLGTPAQYGDINVDDLALQTIYMQNQMGESIRIHRFFSMLGYEYPNVLGEEITIFNLGERQNNEMTDKAIALSEDMPAYPQEGYIKALNDMIVVKLGNIE